MNYSKKITLVSTGRQDLSILQPVADALKAERVDVSILPLEWPAGYEPTPAAAKMMREAHDQTTFHQADMIVLAGDRTETLAIALAAVCLKIPIVHLHGGEITLGAIDNVCRNAISQLATIHCVAHDEARAQLDRMGIQPESIHVTGAPSLDRAWATTTNDAPLEGSPLIAFTYHPTTLSQQTTTQEIGAVLAGVQAAIKPYPNAVVTMSPPNNDAGHEAISVALQTIFREDPRFQFTGWDYYRVLSYADVCVGNSSSGIIEAPTFGCPTVNIGDRQKGRLRCGDVIDCAVEAGQIQAAIESALQTRPPKGRTPRITAYGDGRAAPHIAKVIVDYFASHGRNDDGALRGLREEVKTLRYDLKENRKLLDKEVMRSQELVRSVFDLREILSSHGIEHEAVT